MPGPELCPELAMTDPEEVRAYYRATTERMRELMDELARHPDVRRTYPEIEDALGWKPLSLRGTFSAGTRAVGKGAFGGRRPVHLCRGQESPTDRWETWMDARQAAAIR